MMAKGEIVNQPYTNYFNTLVALVTHLSSTNSESRTVPNMARSLGLAPEEVRGVVTKFPAFFRQSRTESEDGERYYTVHLRYARRYNKQGEQVPTEPLSPQELTTLLDLISKMVAQEYETSRLHLDMRGRNRQLFWTSLITMLAAITAAVVAIIK
jgi:hypothetical protein